MLDLDPARIASQLNTLRYGSSLDVRAQTSSTNDDARQAFNKGAVAGHVVVADTQTGGRGSRGSAWESPAGSDLYVSIVDRFSLALAALPPLTLAVGLAVAECVDALLASDATPPSQVKWPNDVLVHGKKCCGVLIETNASGDQVDGAVIGIGLNVNRTHFPEALADRATSLALARDSRPLDRTRALCSLLSHVETRVDQFVAEGPAAILHALEPRLAYLGQRVTCNGEVGVVRGVDASGCLRLETPHGMRSALVGPLTPVS
jgi:BirA family biotin operon repressor/biotin-[acetyl-CoA-carboxylase] ligase